MLSKKHLLEALVIELSLEAYTTHAIWIELQERGYTTAKGKQISKRKISGIIRAQRNRWVRELDESRDELLATQRAEIQAVKRKLHEEGDYKTLVRYMEMESKLLTPTSNTRINTQNNLFVSAAERVQALQLAAESEATILEGEYVEAG